MMRQLIYCIPFLFILLSCGKEQGDLLTLNSETVAPSEQYLVLGGQDGNHRGLSIYDMDGNYLRGTNFRAEVAIPRGITPFDESSFLVTVDGTDAIYQMDFQGEKTLFHGSAQFSGTQYDVIRTDAGLVYAIESNRIEVFDSDGTRLAANYITNVIGACTLNSPRGLHIRSDGKLLVSDATGGGEILVYDISDPANPVCESAVVFPNTPHGILEHSDGSLYITAQGDHQIYRADLDGSNPEVIWTADITIIRTPTDILELPNGNLLVASTVTDTIEQITTAGERVGTQPFIRDTHSLNISSMAIVGEAEDEE